MEDNSFGQNFQGSVQIGEVEGRKRVLRSCGSELEVRATRRESVLRAEKARYALGLPSLCKFTSALRTG